MELIRISHVAIQEIPQEHRRLLHKMYEDNDLEGAEEAGELINFLEQEAPGSFVGFEANDSVAPPCAYTEGHYPCDYYAPMWFVILVSAVVWEQYKDAVMKKEQEYKDSHKCKIVQRA
jgi:hypothetical protein